MALYSAPGVVANVIRPNTRNGGTDPLELIKEEYSSQVEHTIRRRSALEGFVPMKPVKGTATLTNYAVGETTLGVVTPGTAPDASPAEFGKASITVDTVVYARNTMPLLDVLQTSYDARKELGVEHGKSIAKFRDQAFFIQAAKAAARTNSRYKNAGNELDGWGGGSAVTLANAADAQDPALLHSAFRDLFVKMEQKDVVPREDDVMIALKPDQFYTLQEAEQIVNGMYVTADGTKLDNVAIFKAWGCPVISSNNIPSTNVTGHFLSNARNSNAYDGDFTKLVGLAFSPKALLAGETIPLTSDVYYERVEKMWFVDSHLSFAVTPDRSEYAGAIWLP